MNWPRAVYATLSSGAEVRLDLANPADIRAARVWVPTHDGGFVRYEEVVRVRMAPVAKCWHGESAWQICVAPEGHAGPHDYEIQKPIILGDAAPKRRRRPWGRQ